MKYKIIVRVYVSMFILANIMFLVIEGNKDGFRKSFLVYGSEITEAQFIQLNQLDIATTFIEYVIITLILIGATFTIIQKRENNFKRFILFNGLACMLFYTVGILLAKMEVAPIGNLTQQLILPIYILFFLWIYSVVQFSFKKRKIENHYKKITHP
ncbi:hypothetical protein ACIQ4I_00105 [Rummeliibacillus sp. NPDC094406]|uniref:hypothetical protein n=1 Tax=Rummeliibacillus sp. NPDC094406 TaxID=3364511 RepID=UPI00382C25D9